MQRLLYKKLQEWSKDNNAKPLIIKGARQVGKTYLMLELAKKEFEDYVYINFEQEKSISSIFEGDINPNSIIKKLEIIKNKNISHKTLLIFDEIQECKRALTALKYFNEEAKQYKIICSGSNMGIALHEGTSFPVGKVEILHIYPMSYEEFLLGIGEDKLVNILNEKDIELISSFHEDYIRYLRLYYYIGGMPGILKRYIETKDLNEVQYNQTQLLMFYKEDFSKHLDNILPTRINLVYDSIASQLTKENKKFVYGAMKKGARASEYEYALHYLKDIGLVNMVYRVGKPGYPISFYKDLSAFKLYINDVGLLSCMCKVHSDVALDGDNILTEFKGALTEQYVLEQLIIKYDYEPYYYANETSTGEIEFIMQDKNDVIPIEVKARENLQAKSLKNYIKKYNPSYAIKLSMKPYKKNDIVINVPLYAINLIER